MSLFTKKPRKRILIVDDEPLILQMTSEFLREEGFDTATALRAVEALAVLKKGGVDAMLLDICLPDQNGLVFLAELKKLYADLPVVMLTGSGYDEALMKKALEGGAAGYVSKDTEMENMVLAVKRLFN